MPLEQCPAPGLDAASLACSVRNHVTHSLGKPGPEASSRDLATALSMSLRDRLVDKMLETRDRFRQSQAKRMYYLSIEYLLGRCLGNNLCNMGLGDVCRQMLAAWGFDFDEVRELERDPALGNGGLGRLAACFLDSLATLDMPGNGYGIHYEFGLFKQSIENDRQVERPDYWLAEGMPLQIERRDQAVIVPLYGRVEDHRAPDGSYLPLWVDWRDLVGLPYDIPIVGYGNRTVNYLRLFAARATDNFDMQIFDQGDYLKAIQQKVYSELISKVLYPSESISFGRELRLIQEYFLVFCALRDITRRFLKQNRNIEDLPDFVAIQLNDTHPALTVAELMRILVDERRVPWDRAWNVTTRTLAFTNHTLMPESLEMWPVDMLGKVLPRHLQIIYEINKRFLDQIRLSSPEVDDAKLRRLSLIEEDGGKQVRMAHLAVVGSHSVNGVSRLHSELVKTVLFPDYAALWPGKFNNKTNGITPRRWLRKCNPGLAALITEAIGEDWITDLDALRGLEPLAADAAFRERFMAVKLANKARLADYFARTTGIIVPPRAAFDMQCKRVHEYKRQLLNVMRIIHDYLRLTEDGLTPPVPRVYVFAGKAAPGYFEAKSIINLILRVAKVINADKLADPWIKVVFAADYRVSLAEKLIPAADVSEQISTAGTEASGTGNMKFSLNGALTIGTLDGANIEIREAVGAENFHLFGLTTPEVTTLLRDGYDPWHYHARHPEIRRVLDALSAGRFTPEAPETFHWIFDKLLSRNERYLHLADFMSYVEAQERLGLDYAAPEVWARKAILNVARMGPFSSDRTIKEYARDIWNIKPVPPRQEKPRP